MYAPETCLHVCCMADNQLTPLFTPLSSFWYLYFDLRTNSAACLFRKILIPLYGFSCLDEHRMLHISTYRVTLDRILQCIFYRRWYSSGIIVASPVSSSHPHCSSTLFWTGASQWDLCLAFTFYWFTSTYQSHCVVYLCVSGPGVVLCHQPIASVWLLVPILFL